MQHLSASPWSVMHWHYTSGQVKAKNDSLSKKSQACSQDKASPHHKIHLVQCKHESMLNLTMSRIHQFMQRRCSTTQVTTTPAGVICKSIPLHVSPSRINFSLQAFQFIGLGCFSSFNK
ncbi:hypothetical protein ILYODFUR_036689 [Ilyodon furcidens]|uniref:Uncharacterized protein n=1 Tax=Ilyodon furcidens TaxID=33524 RepID=A0ABV0ST96_9TELE